MLTVMQLVGARRYAVWTFGLTVIALDLGQRSHEIGWHAAIDRILLTIGGLALAKPFSLSLPQSPVGKITFVKIAGCPFRSAAKSLNR
jgi:hypothetical protein